MALSIMATSTNTSPSTDDPTNVDHNSSNGKRKRQQTPQPLITPRKTKLRKLNATPAIHLPINKSIPKGYPFTNQNNSNCVLALRSKSTVDDGASSVLTKKQRRRSAAATLCRRLLYAVVLVGVFTAAAIGGPPALESTISSVRVEIGDLFHYCRQHFEHEFHAAFADVNDDEADKNSRRRSLTSNRDRIDATVRDLNYYVAHQSEALHRIEFVLRNHSRLSNVSAALQPHLDDDRPLSAMALIGGSGTGKTLTVNILMRRWLAQNNGHLLHFIWPADKSDMLGEITADLSRYSHNLCVIDGIPAAQYDHVQLLHRGVAAFVRDRGSSSRFGGRRAASVLIVYVLTVPTHQASSVRERENLMRQARETMQVAGIVPVGFEAMKTTEQLQECVRREHRRRHRQQLSALRRQRAFFEDQDEEEVSNPADEEAVILREDQLRLILEGIEPEQSGCKHIGARMSMYL